MKKIKIGGGEQAKELEVQDEVFDVLTADAATIDGLKAVVETTAAVSAAVETATGQKDPKLAIAALAGLKEKAATADVLAKENAELKADAAKAVEAKKQAEIAAMIEAASKDGRLTPANRAKLTAADAPAYAKDPDALKAFLEMLPVVAPPSGAAPVAGDDKVVALTDEEKRFAETQRIKPEHVAVFKAGGPEALRKVLEAEKAKK